MTFITKFILSLLIIRFSIVNYIKYSTDLSVNLSCSLEILGIIGSFLFYIMALYGVSHFKMNVFSIKPSARLQAEKDRASVSGKSDFLIGLTFMLLLLSGFILNILAMSFGPMGGTWNQIIEIASMCLTTFFMVVGFISFATEK